MVRQAKSPALPLYGKDAWSDERFLLLDWDAQGLFWRLAFLQWMEGDIPANVDAVIDIVGKARQTRRLWPTMLNFFIPVPDAPGRLYNLTTHEHRVRMMEKRQLQEAGAAATNGKRWGSRSGDATRGQRLGDAKRRARHTPEEWDELLAAFHGHCAKCLAVPTRHLSKDHITPLALDGSDGIENLQPLCYQCNVKKGGDCTDYRLTFCDRLATSGVPVSFSLSDTQIAINKAVTTRAGDAGARAATASADGSLADPEIKTVAEPEKPLTAQQLAVKRVFDALEEHTTGFLLPDGGRVAKWISLYGIDVILAAIADEGVKGNLDGRNPSYLQQCIESAARRGGHARTIGARSDPRGAGKSDAPPRKPAERNRFGQRTAAELLAEREVHPLPQGSSGGSDDPMPGV